MLLSLTWIVSLVQLSGWCLVFGDDEEELVWVASLLALGQHQAGWESAVSLTLVQWEFAFSLNGQHDLLVQFVVGGAVVDESVKVD